MLTYLDGLKKDYPKLHTMTLETQDAARSLFEGIETYGFEDTEEARFQRLLGACTTMLSLRDTYQIPDEDWRWCEIRNGKGSVRMHPWYWSIFVVATRQMAHMAFLMLSVKQGKLRPYQYDIIRNGPLLGLPVLPLSVIGKHFYVNKDRISKTWVKSMLYIEMQLGLVCRRDHAMRLWRQAFPHGANRDLARAFNHSHPTWWLDIAAEEIVSKHYPPISTENKAAKREDVCRMPECAETFFSKFPGVAEPFLGNLAPFEFPKRTADELVSDLMEWAHVYKLLGVGCDPVNYVVIPAQVTVKDFLLYPKPEYGTMEIKGIVDRTESVTGTPEKSDAWRKGLPVD